MQPAVAISVTLASLIALVASVSATLAQSAVRLGHGEALRPEVRAAQQPLTAIALGDGVYGIKGPGTDMNTGFVVGEQGVFVFACDARTFEGRMAAIRSVTDKPIRWVANGHAASDDAGCNDAFKAMGATVFASARAREGDYFQRNPASAPDATFEDSLTFHLGTGRTVELMYMGHGHSSGDAVAYIPEQRVLFSADLLFVDIHPTVTQGDSANWQRILERLAAWDIEWIVSGHGAIVRGTDALGTLWQYFETMRDQVRGLMRQGMSLEEIQAAVDLGSYSAWGGLRPTSAAEVIDKLYQELREAGK